ncbi:hypothetical protein N9514_04495 [Pseudomonadales bacterium]|nr:hypothetical protein [Pseudomonadales bacterium]
MKKPKPPITLSDDNLLSLLSKSSSTDERESVARAYFYFANRDGSIRWVYPKSLKSPTFLNFFNQSSARSKLIKILIAILFYRNLYFAKLAKKTQLVIDVAGDSILGDLISRSPDANYSIFLGTVGENRKVIIEVNDNRNSFSFIKIGVSDASKLLVENEYKTLKLLGKIDVTSFSVPVILDYRGGILEISNINTDGAYQSNKLSPIHFSALNELYAIGVFYIQYHNLILESTIKKEIASLEERCSLDSHNNGIDLETLVPKLKGIRELLQSDYLFPCSMSHGDFTPWNMYLRHDCLGIIDWELSVDEVPLFFDVFHFVFQSEVLLNQASYFLVKEEIYAALSSPVVKTMRSSFRIDINQHFIFYLLFNVSRYLDLYATQETPHEQIYWMVSVWEKAMDDVVSSNGEPLTCD